MLDVIRIPALRDNYIYLLRGSDGETAVVDPSEAGPVERELSRRGWKLDRIFNTHHHWDHTGGNPALKSAYGCEVVGFMGDRHRIDLDRTVEDGDTVSVGAATARVIAVPGHTSGHVALWFESEKALFCGDTLFLMGCGRLFEGTPVQMWRSLSRLRELPDDTRVYCGHEYTEDNLNFALTLEPDSAALREREREVRRMRRLRESTVPDVLGKEKRTNPFLRVDLPEFQNASRIRGTAEEVFAEVRRRKDHF